MPTTDELSMNAYGCGEYSLLHTSCECALSMSFAAQYQRKTL
jgi:hypothetical protein